MYDYMNVTTNIIGFRFNVSFGMSTLGLKTKETPKLSGLCSLEAQFMYPTEFTLGYESKAWKV